MPGSSRREQEDPGSTGSVVPGFNPPPGATGDITDIPPPAPAPEESLFAIGDTIYPKVIFSSLVYPFEDAQSVAQKAALVELVNEQRMLIVVDLSWKDVETSNGVFVWSKYDTLVTWAHANEIDIMFNITNVPGWANGAASATTPPTDPTDFADFAADAAQRYGPYGDFVYTFGDGWWVSKWMLWDKVSTAMTPAPDATLYAPIVTESYTALLAKSPINRIYLGGMTAASSVGWMNTLYGNGCLGKFHAATLSPYDGTALVAAAESSIVALRNAMTAVGDTAAKIFVKFGLVATSSQGAALNTYRIQMTKLFNLSADAWRGNVSYGTSMVAWNSLSDTAEGNYGLITSGSTPLHKDLAFDAFKALVASDGRVLSPLPKMIHGNLAPPFADTHSLIHRNTIVALKGGREQRIIVRVALKWKTIEPNAAGDNRWNAGAFGGFDALVTWAFDNGLELWFTIEATPGWANGGEDELHAPTAPSTMADFATLAAARYAPGGTFVTTLGTGHWGVRLWAVQNEPNLHVADGWTATKYANTLTQCYAAIKGVTADCSVAAAAMANGGYSGFPTGAAYINQLFTAGLTNGNADVWPCNPYSDAVLNDAEPKISAIRTALNNRGEGSKPMAITEWGFVGQNPQNLNHKVEDAGIAIAEFFNIRRPTWLVAFNMRHMCWFALSDLPDGTWGLITDDRYLAQYGIPDGSLKAGAENYNVFKDGVRSR